MSELTTSRDIRNATSSRELVGGRSLSALRCGRTIDLFGQEVVPANPLAPLGSKKAKQTNGISGQCGFGSSASANLQLSLENRLRQRLPTAGGMMWQMIWKAKGTPAGSAVLPACSVGKPHKRDRLWFVGNARQQCKGNESVGFSGEWQHSATAGVRSEAGHRFTNTGSLGDTRLQRQAIGEQQTTGFEQSGESLAVGNAELHGCDDSSQRGSVGTGENQGRVLQSERPSASEFMADTECLGQQGQGAVGKSQHSTPCGDGQANQPVYDCTGEYEWLICPDGKTRPVKRGISLLAHGIQHRTPILHAFGNAIVPQVAAEFIKAVSEV